MRPEKKIDKARKVAARFGIDVSTVRIKSGKPAYTFYIPDDISENQDKISLLIKETLPDFDIYVSPPGEKLSCSACYNTYHCIDPKTAAPYVSFVFRSPKKVNNGNRYENRVLFGLGQFFKKKEVTVETATIELLCRSYGLSSEKDSYASCRVGRRKIKPKNNGYYISAGSCMSSGINPDFVIYKYEDRKNVLPVSVKTEKLNRITFLSLGIKQALIDFDTDLYNFLKIDRLLFHERFNLIPGNDKIPSYFSNDICTEHDAQESHSMLIKSAIGSNYDILHRCEKTHKTCLLSITKEIHDNLNVEKINVIYPALDDQKRTKNKWVKILFHTNYSTFICRIRNSDGQYLPEKMTFGFDANFLPEKNSI